MARNAIESDFRSSKMAQIGLPKSCVLIWNGEKCDRKRFPVIQNGRRQPFCEQKIIVAYWSEMTRNCHQKWISVIQNGRWQPFCEKYSCLLTEMARNAITSDFRSSKMAAGSQFVRKKIKVAYWSEMARNAIDSNFRSSKMAAGSHFVNNFKKIKLRNWSEMARNAIESDFRSFKMAAGSHFVNKIKKSKSCVLIWNGEKCDRKWFSVMPPAAILWEKNQSCVLILNGEKCDRNSFSVIQNRGRGITMASL